MTPIRSQMSSAWASRCVENRTHFPAALSDRTGPGWHHVLRLVTGLTWAVSLTDDPRRATAPLAFVHELMTDADETFEQIRRRSAYQDKAGEMAEELTPSARRAGPTPLHS